MSMSFSSPLLIQQEHFVTGLLKLSFYEDTFQNKGPYFYLKNTPISQIVSQLPNYIGRIHTSDKIDPTEDYVAQCSLVKSGQVVTVILMPWAQRIFSVSETGKYLWIDLSLSMDKNQDYIPVDHPSLPFLHEVAQAFQPVYGGLAGDWAGEPSVHWEEDNPSPSTKLPWHEWTTTQVLGSPLSSIIKQHIDLDSPDNGFFYVKNLGNSIYWITWPGSQKDWRSLANRESLVYKNHVSRV